MVEIQRVVSGAGRRASLLPVVFICVLLLSVAAAAATSLAQSPSAASHVPNASDQSIPPFQRGPVFDVPIPVGGVTEIVTDGYANCSIVGGRTLCWGESVESDTPVPVDSIPIGATGLFPASTKPGLCAILTGQVLCPGKLNSTTEQAGLPALGAGVSAVSEGCAIVQNGAKCWGQGNWGQLGNGASADSPTPVSVVGLTSGVSSISASGQNACAIVGGSLKCWGSGYQGALGNGVDEDSNVPVQVAGLESGVTSVDARYWPLACGAANGVAFCWGRGSKGNGANGSGASHLVPVPVAGLTNNVTAISAGFAHTCVIDAGAAKCWGSGSRGQLGDGRYRRSKTPVQVKGLTSGVTAIAAGYENTCAIANGAVKCWGNGDRGQIGAPVVLKGPKSIRFGRRFTLKLSTPAYSRVSLKIKVGKSTVWASGPYRGALFSKVYRGGEFRFKLNLERHVFARLRYPRGAPFATARIERIKRLLRSKPGSGSLVLTPSLVDGSSPRRPVTIKLH